MNRTERVGLAIVATVVGAALLWRGASLAAPSMVVDDCDRAVARAGRSGRSFAGSDPVDCGDGSTRDRACLDGCIVAAFTAGRPFVALLREQGVDSAVGRVIAGRSSGVVQQFGFDSDPSGGGHVGAVVHASECVGPHVDDVHGTKRPGTRDQGPFSDVPSREKISKTEFYTKSNGTLLASLTYRVM